MQRIAKFHKVSFEQFKVDWADTFPDTPEEGVIHIYEGIRFPAKVTSGSAGYDFFTPVPLILAPGENMKVPTGIKVETDTGWVLQIFPRSSLGFKLRLQLNNAVGITDSDYFYSDNEGHMFIKVINDFREGKTVELGQGMGFAQGIFISYGITVDDECSDVRNDGFGSMDAGQVEYMESRGERSYSSGRKPQPKGQYPVHGGKRPVSNAARRCRRKNRIIRAAIARVIRISLAGLIAAGTFRLAVHMTTSKKRQFRAEGVEKLDAGDYTGAIGSSDTTLEKSGKGAEEFSRDVLLYRVDAEFLLKDYSAAIHTYDLLLGVRPDTPEYMHRQSSCYVRLGDTDNAIKRYQEAEALVKKDKPVSGRQETLLATGSARVGAKEYDKAMTLYGNALKDGTEHGEIYNQMGLYQIAAQDYQSAYDSFDKGYQVAATAQTAALREKDWKTGGETDKKETKDGDTGTTQSGETVNGESVPAGVAPTGGSRELLKELLYNRAVACEHLQQYDKALVMFEDFVKEFGSDKDAEYEIAFLKTR